MATVKYASWNMKNLSTNSIQRQHIVGAMGANQPNLVTYINAVNTNNIDVLGILEVTINTGEQAVQKLSAAMTNFGSCITQNRTYITRKGEFNAILYRNTLTDGTTTVDATNIAEQNFPQNVTFNKKPILFLNRVPVLFKIPLSNPKGKTLQVITWHAPQPGDIVPASELKAFAYILTFLIGNKTIDKAQPLVFSADFNFDTNPAKVAAWNDWIYTATDTNTDIAYLKQFAGLVNGTTTTLVAKDPTQYAKNPYNPIDFDDLLANAYDNILANKNAIASATAASGINGVLNHISIVAGGQALINFFNPSQKLNNLTLLIKNANKISDHCAVLTQITF